MHSKIKFVRFFLREDYILKKGKYLSKLDNLIFKFISIGAKRALLRSYTIYMDSKQVPKNVAELIILANYRTNGKIRKDIIKNQSFKKVEFNSKFFYKTNLSEVLESLNRCGYAQVGHIREKNVLNDLSLLKKEMVFSRNKNTEAGKKDHYESNSPNPKIDHIWYVKPDSVLENPAIQSLIQDGFWKQLADNYLGASTRLTSLRCWHSFPSYGKNSLSPENWHLDAGDGLNFLKFFILLSDVDENTGPTAIVPVRSNDLPKKFFTGRRFSDYEINTLLLKHNTQQILATGKFGTIYTMDTRLLHRGTPVEVGHRFLVNWMASVDTFGSIKNEKYSLKQGNLLLNHPDLISSV